MVCILAQRKTTTPGVLGEVLGGSALGQKEIGEESSEVLG